MDDRDSAAVRPRGGYRPGAETRARLIEAALVLFGERGFDAASTRDIAARAEAAVPAIVYHFGSKEGLYLACADHVVGRYRDRMLATIMPIERQVPALSPDYLKGIIDLMTGMVIDDDRSAGWVTFMISEMNKADRAHEVLFREVWAPGIALVTRLIAAVRTRTEPVEDDRLDALLLLSGLSAITTSRAVTIAFNGWDDLDRPHAMRLFERMKRQIDLL